MLHAKAELEYAIAWLSTHGYHDSNLQKETHLQCGYMFLEQQRQISGCCFRVCNTNLFTAHHLGNSHCQVRDVESITHELIMGFTQATHLWHMHHSLLNLSRGQSNVPTKLLVNGHPCLQTIRIKIFHERGLQLHIYEVIQRNVNGIGTTTENARCLRLRCFETQTTLLYSNH